MKTKWGIICPSGENFMIAFFGMIIGLVLRVMFGETQLELVDLILGIVVYTYLGGILLEMFDYFDGKKGEDKNG